MKLGLLFPIILVFVLVKSLENFSQTGGLDSQPALSIMFSVHHSHILVDFVLQVLNEGYAAHLQDLTLSSMISPSTCNARLFLQKSSFTLPGQKPTKAKKSQQHHHHHLSSSLPRGSLDRSPAITVDTCGNTTIDPGLQGGFSNSSKVRGRIPKLNILQRIPDDMGGGGAQSQPPSRKSLSS